MSINLRDEHDPRGGNRFAPARFTLPMTIPTPRHVLASLGRSLGAGAPTRRWRGRGPSDRTRRASRPSRHSAARLDAQEHRRGRGERGGASPPRLHRRRPRRSAVAFARPPAPPERDPALHLDTCSSPCSATATPSPARADAGGPRGVPRRGARYRNPHDPDQAAGMSTFAFRRSRRRTSLSRPVAHRSTSGVVILWGRHCSTGAAAPDRGAPGEDRRAPRLGATPRQHIARVPLDLGRPEWVDAPTSRSPATSTWSPCRRPATRPHSFASPRTYTWSRSVKIARCGS